MNRRRAARPEPGSSQDLRAPRFPLQRIGGLAMLALRPLSTKIGRTGDTCDAPAAAGKTTEHTDTYHGNFVRLVLKNEKLVEVDEFEAEDHHHAR